MKTLRGVAIGAGYFSHYHYDAWTRLPGVEIVALANREHHLGRDIAGRFGIPRVYAFDELDRMFECERPDFVDVITPPETHADIIRLAAQRRLPVICQKPLAPTREEAARIVATARAAKVPLMVHENWRWQPWYREIRRQLDAGTLGQLFSLSVRMRVGDGWAADAYQDRQPYFREYPRLMVYETGVHFLDVFQYLGGEIQSVYARLQKRNRHIAGEDAAQIVCGFRSGATAILDASRYNEAETEDPRYTFGTVRLDGEKGHLELDLDGNLRLKLLGRPGVAVNYARGRRGFAGDSVAATQQHFVERLRDGGDFETSGEDYLRTIALVEACYRSQESGQAVVLPADE